MKEIFGPQWLILSALHDCGFRIDYPGAFRELNRVGLHDAVLEGLEMMPLWAKRRTGRKTPIEPLTHASPN